MQFTGNASVFLTFFRLEWYDYNDSQQKGGPLRWIQQQPDVAHVEALSREAGLSPLLARVLVNRGVFTSVEAHRFLSPSPADLNDPFLLPDMSIATERLHRAATQHERVMLFGDYDVDGISAVSIYRELCRVLGLDPIIRLPHRLSEGYGLSRAAIAEAQDCGVSLLITADCGATAFDEIALARDSGIDVIVTDHHQVPRTLPVAIATINPWREDATYPFRGLCSAGLAWKVASAVAQKPWGKEVQHHLAAWTDLAALGTIADVMPLREENRYLVREGLRLLSDGRRPGIRALKRVAGLDGKAIGVGSVGFSLAPRLNAPGRLGDAGACVELLTTTDATEAARLSEHLQRENIARRQIEQTVLGPALAQAASYATQSAIVVAGRGWHPGVIGIVAARLVERYYRPSIVIAIDETTGVGKGSGRTIPGVDLYRMLTECAPRLLQFGGHRMAAGLTIQADQIDSFRTAFQAAVSGVAETDVFEPVLKIDAEVNLAACNWSLVEDLSRLAPFGSGNPEPVFVARGVAPTASRRVGNGHLRLSLTEPRSTLQPGLATAGGGGGEVGNQPGVMQTPPVSTSVPGGVVEVEAIAFGQADRYGDFMAARSGTGDITPCLDVAFTIKEDRWQGQRKVQLQVKEMRPSDQSASVARLPSERIGASPP